MLRPHPLFDTAKQIANLKSDHALGTLLGVSLPYICKMRNRHMGVGPTTILAMHEKLGMSVADIRVLIARADHEEVEPAHGRNA